MPVTWTYELEAEVIRLRDKENMDWQTIKDELDFDTPDQPRVRYSRLKNGRPRSPRAAELHLDKEATTKEQAIKYEAEASFANHKYKFDEQQRMYSFPVYGTIVDIPAAIWQQIVTEYSALGADRTCYEVAARHGMHKKVLEACLKLYGHFKSRPPATREELVDAAATGEFGPLYDRAIEVGEQRFTTDLTLRKLAHLTSRNQQLEAKLADVDETKADILTALHELAANFPLAEDFSKPAATPCASDYLLTVFDAHFGLKVGTESGWSEKEYSAEIAGEYLVRYAETAAERITLNGGAKTAHLVNGGDTFHAFMQRTKGGTPLEREKPDRLVFRDCLAAHLKAIEILRNVSQKVVVRIIPGNHDHIFAELLEEVLAIHYMNVTDVDVPNVAAKRKAFLVGECLHVFDHGEGFERLNDKQFAKVDIVARRMGGKDFAKAKKVYFYVGHTHHKENKEHGAHLEIIRVPTWAHSNDYEESLMHDTDPTGLFLRLDARGRIEAEDRVYLLDEAA